MKRFQDNAHPGYLRVTLPNRVRQKLESKLADRFRRVTSQIIQQTGGPQRVVSLAKCEGFVFGRLGCLSLEAEPVAVRKVGREKAVARFNASKMLVG